MQILSRVAALDDLEPDRSLDRIISGPCRRMAGKCNSQGEPDIYVRREVSATGISLLQSQQTHHLLLEAIVEQAGMQEHGPLKVFTEVGRHVRGGPALSRV